MISGIGFNGRKIEKMEGEKFTLRILMFGGLLTWFVFGDDQLVLRVPFHFQYLGFSGPRGWGGPVLHAIFMVVLANQIIFTCL